MENLQGAATITSALHYRIRSCQILVTGKQQKPIGGKTRTRSGSGPAVGEGTRKNNGFAGVEVQWVVLVCVVMPELAFLLAADFAKPAWVRFLPGEDIYFPRLEEPVVTG